MSEQPESLPVDVFRVLVVDDEEEVHDAVRSLFEDDPDVLVISAATQEEALGKIDRFYFDAAIVDIELRPVDAGGFDVLRKFAVAAPETPIVIYTQYIDPTHVRDLLSVIKDSPPRVIGVVDKTPLGTDNFDPHNLRLPLTPIITGWRESAVQLSGEEIALNLLAERSKQIANFRSDRAEVETELDRICRTLFGRVRGLASGSQIGVRFESLGSQGFSAAITVEAKVILGEDAGGDPITGSRCVLKIGPVADIREEVERYDHFVKYGVRLRQRVELLGHTYQRALGAVCYSFAGGVFGSKLISLSELFEAGADADLAREAIASLFDPSTQSWYSVQGNRESGVAYVTRTYGTKFVHCFEVLDASLSKLRNRLREPHLHAALGGFIDYTKAQESVDGSFEVAGRKLSIPRMNILGAGKFVAPLPACLIHGDMHGSNVMLELEEGSGTGGLRRACLIDYRSAGPGPRAIDAIALQASLRIADGREIVAATSRAGDPEQELAEAVRIAAGRVDAEELLLSEFGTTGSDRQSHWEALDREIGTALHTNFVDMSVVEYLATALPFTLRYFGLSLDSVTRVRLLAWVSALLRALDQATTEQIVVSVNP